MSEALAPAALPLLKEDDVCWQRIGVWGDQSCPQLQRVTHCNNCEVFAEAGRRFLDAPPPADYLSEWTARLAIEHPDATKGQFGALVFRIADEWLALPVEVLVEVTEPRQPRRIPHRGGMIAGLINIRGELHLCVRLELLLGIAGIGTGNHAKKNSRLVLMRGERESWGFLVDEVDQVRRLDVAKIADPPPTLSRVAARVTRGVVVHRDRSIGLLEHSRLFEAIRERMR